MGFDPAATPVLTPLPTPALKVMLPPVLGVLPPLRVRRHRRQHPIIEAKSLFEHAPKPEQSWTVWGAAYIDLERASPILSTRE